MDHHPTRESAATPRRRLHHLRLRNRHQSRHALPRLRKRRRRRRRLIRTFRLVEHQQERRRADATDTRRRSLRAARRALRFAA
jgi:hypothetical protein